MQSRDTRGTHAETGPAGSFTSADVIDTAAAAHTHTHKETNKEQFTETPAQERRSDSTVLST